MSAARSWQVLSAAATILVVVLALRVHGLRLENRELLRLASDPHAGLVVPAVSMVTLDGEAVTVGAPESARQVLLFFTTTCPYCAASLSPWRRIALAARDSAAGFSVLGVALDSVADVRRYASVHRLPFRVTILTERRLARIFRATRVPLTMVVDSSREAIARPAMPCDPPRYIGTCTSDFQCQKMCDDFYGPGTFGWCHGGCCECLL